MPNAIWLVAVVALAMIAALIVVGQSKSTPRSLAITLKDGNGSTSRVIDPSPMRGVRELTIENIEGETSKVQWDKASEALRFFWEKIKPYRQFFCPGDTFALQISEMSSAGPSLVGIPSRMEHAGDMACIYSLARAYPASARQGISYRDGPWRRRCPRLYL